MKQKSITEMIDDFMELLPTITQEEANQVQKILNWTNEEKIAFKLAKKMFEEKE